MIQVVGAQNRNSANDADFSENDFNLKIFLSQWSIKHTIPVRAMNELLEKLKLFDKSLPQDIRTLRETPRKTSIVEMGKGTYFHYGLENCLTDFLHKMNLSGESDSLKLNFGIDGKQIMKLWIKKRTQFQFKQ